MPWVVPALPDPPAPPSAPFGLVIPRETLIWIYMDSPSFAMTSDGWNVVPTALLYTARCRAWSALAQMAKPRTGSSSDRGRLRASCPSDSRYLRRASAWKL